MMRNLTYVAFTFELTVSSIAFGALFMSAMPLEAKIFFAASLILLVGILDLHAAQSTTFSELHLRVSEAQARVLEARIDHRESPSLDDAYDRLTKELALENAISTKGITYAGVLLGKFGLWIGAGMLIGNYVLPFVIQKYN